MEPKIFDANAYWAGRFQENELKPVEITLCSGEVFLGKLYLVGEYIVIIRAKQQAERFDNKPVELSSSETRIIMAEIAAVTWHDE